MSSPQPRPGDHSSTRGGGGLGRHPAAVLAGGLAGGLLLAQLIQATVTRLSGLLVALVIAFFLSLAMEPAVQWLERRGMRRGFGTALVFLVLALLAVGFVAAMVPLLLSQVRTLVASAPQLLDALGRQAATLPPEVGEPLAAWLAEQRQALPTRVPGVAGEVGRGALGVGQTLLGGIVELLAVLLVTFYLVADGPRMRRTLVSWLAPPRQRDALAIWELAIDKTGGYVYSRLLIAVASAGFHVIAFTLIELPYSAALGVYVGIVSSLIPVVGTYVAGALPVVVALADSPGMAVWVLVAIVVYQQFENYLVMPRITGATMELHPAVAFVSVLIGGALLGAAGALLALPATAIVAALISAYGERHEVMEHGLVEETRSRDRPRATRRRDRDTSGRRP